MPEHDPEQELGAKICSALHDHAGPTGPQGIRMAHEARRRVQRRRQTWAMTAAAVFVVAAVGGVWGVAGGGSSQVATSGGDAGSAAASGPNRNSEGVAPKAQKPACPTQHPIQRAASPNAVPAGTGLDLRTPVTGLRACRYSLADGTVLGQQVFDATVAQQVVDAIKVLPERNPALPAFKCAPQTAKPSEAIVLRFDTVDGVREIWVEYDGCQSAGFFTGTHTYGLYSAPLKLFMVDTVRPSGGTYLNALKDW